MKFRIIASVFILLVILALTALFSGGSDESSPDMAPVEFTQ